MSVFVHVGFKIGIVMPMRVISANLNRFCDGVSGDQKHNCIYVNIDSSVSEKDVGSRKRTTNYTVPPICASTKFQLNFFIYTIQLIYLP